MNNNLYQNLAGVGKSNVEAFEAVAQHALAGVEQLGQLNFAASKAAMQESFEHVQSLLEVRDPQQFIALQSGVIQPIAEKSASYLRQIYDIMSSANAEIAKIAEARMSEAQQNFTTLLDEAVKNAPMNSEAVSAMFKNAFSASQEAINSAQNAARQVVATAESNVATLTDQASEATDVAARAVSRKR